jgi:aryl-alcohol dehydrogenase-like predicted oxidoreductase
MMQYSLLDRRPEESCFSLLKQHNISVVTRGSVAQGMLTGKPAQPYLGHSKEQVETAAEAIKNMAGRQELEAATAIRYVLHQPVVASAVVGMRTATQLEEALRISEMPELSPEAWEKLNLSAPAKQYAEHR